MKLFGYEFIVRKAGIVSEPSVFDVRRVECNPGDTVVITTEHSMSMETADRVRMQWEKFSPETKAIVLSDGLRLSVLGSTVQMAH